MDYKANEFAASVLPLLLLHFFYIASQLVRDQGVISDVTTNRDESPLYMAEVKESGELQKSDESDEKHGDSETGVEDQNFEEQSSASTLPDPSPHLSSRRILPRTDRQILSKALVNALVYAAVVPDQDSQSRKYWKLQIVNNGWSPP